MPSYCHPLVAYNFLAFIFLLQVLMQTRSEKTRAIILGLRIVKYLVVNLKEEYLELLAETIPFLVELLEDVELSVKSLAQLNPFLVKQYPFAANSTTNTSPCFRQYISKFWNTLPQNQKKRQLQKTKTSTIGGQPF